MHDYARFCAKQELSNIRDQISANVINCLIFQHKQHDRKNPNIYSKQNYWDMLRVENISKSNSLRVLCNLPPPKKYLAMANDTFYSFFGGNPSFLPFLQNRPELRGGIFRKLLHPTTGWERTCRARWKPAIFRTGWPLSGHILYNLSMSWILSSLATDLMAGPPSFLERFFPLAPLVGVASPAGR